MHSTDILIIGSGVAGLSFALKVAPFARVALITKKSGPTLPPTWPKAEWRRCCPEKTGWRIMFMTP